MPTYLAKPAYPLWQPGRAPAGCKSFIPLSEGAGRTVRDLSGRSGNGAFTGSPAWQRGLYGPRLGGFTTADYVAIDPATQILASVYPCWAAVMFVNTSTAISCVFSQGRSSSGTPRVTILLNQGGTGKLDYQLRPDSGVPDLDVTSAALTINDGLPHVGMIVSFTASDHRLYCDGLQVASSSSTVGTLTSNRLSLGVSRLNAVASPFSGSILAFSAGNGAVPDPAALAGGWLSGRFPAVRNPGTSLFYLGSAAAAYAASIAAFGTLAATSGPATLAASMVAAVPPPSAATLAGTAGAATFSATASASVPPPSAATFAGTSGPATLSASVLAAVPPPSAGTFSVTLASATFSASGFASLLSTINPAIPTGFAGTIAVYAGNPDETQGTIGPYAGEPDPIRGTIQES